MRPRPKANLAALALGAAGLAGCAAQQQTAERPYEPVASVLELMESVVAHSAEEYWGAVSIVVDEDGVTENFPEGDEEWEEVWSAGMTLAESGNLLMMPPRAIEEEAWMRHSRDLVEVGREAAQAARERDPDRVLAVGEEVYNVCVACHDDYAAELSQRVSSLGRSAPSRALARR